MMRKKLPGQQRTTFRLTEIEKLDGRYPGVAFHVKGWLDQGIPSAEIVGLIHGTFHLPVTEAMVENYRYKRWVPEKELVAIKIAVTKAAIEAFGGDAGLDAAILAKLWELMDKMSIPQLISARTLFIKVRAQNLKEQEFLYKTGQLKPGNGEEIDRETQQRNVLRRVKEIFGLADDDPPAAVVTTPVPPRGPAPPVSRGEPATAPLLK